MGKDYECVYYFSFLILLIYKNGQGLWMCVLFLIFNFIDYNIGFTRLLLPQILFTIG